MKEWKKYKLGEILTVKYGKDHKKLEDGPIPVYGSGGLMRFVNSYICDSPSILIPRKGSLNNVMYVEHPFWTVDTMFWTIIDTTVAVPRFVYYAICKIDFESLNVGSAVPSMTVPIIEDIEIHLPSLDEQKRIVKVLSSLESKIELNRQINDNLEQQAQALYKSWFVDFEPFKDQEFVESEFGLIPEGWHCTTISELLSIKYGKDHKKLAEGIVPVYGSGGLMRYVDTKLHEGEAVLIPRKGSLNNVMYVNEAFWTVDTMFYSIPKQEYSCIYAYLFLANKDLASMNAGSAVPSMTTDILNSMHIIAPPVEVLKRFNNICDVYFSRINQNNIENANLSKQRDTLLPKLMSGELKINEIDC